MNKEFIPYKQAQALKELGFNEPCLKIWEKTMLFTTLVNPEEFKRVVSERYTKAPLYQQAFRWFREKHDLFISIDHHENRYSINDLKSLRRFNNYEEAELACLNKLIEIVKAK
jgi:hypothetical protein